MAGDLDPENPFDALMVIPAANYMEYNPDTGSYRVKIDLESTDGAFIGMSAMQGHIFVYDVEQKRIGFAEASNCSPWDPNSAVMETDVSDIFQLEMIHDLVVCSILFLVELRMT
jgi:hypothetical protein